MGNETRGIVYICSNSHQSSGQRDAWVEAIAQINSEWGDERNETEHDDGWRATMLEVRGEIDDA